MKKMIIGLLVLFFSVACQAQQSANSVLILATTTSTQDSGLLDVLIPSFEAQSGYTVKVVAVGTGKALEMGRNGDADVLLVHAPAAEEEFMRAGYGAERYLVMHNDFVLVGPATDPAGVGQSQTAATAFERLAAAQAPFISRGDDSGTHKKELSLWQAAGIVPGWEGYLEAGQGMAATLRIADEKEAYTLTDRATFLANQETLDLVILLEGDPLLLNVYHVITVNPERWPLVNAAGAQAFADFMLAPETQETIRTFGTDRFGQPLFFPDAGKDEADLGL